MVDVDINFSENQIYIVEMNIRNIRKSQTSQGEYLNHILKLGAEKKKK